MEDFLRKMGECLESEVTAQTRFREVDGWCSLMAFSMLMTIERDFGRTLPISELMACSTLDELYGRISR